MWAKLKPKLAKLHKSATIWFNGVYGATLVTLPQAQDMFPNLLGHIPDKLYHYGMAVLVIGNILLRFKTNKALQDK
jgi:hypothetical protein